jgi:hypothetical protein
LPIVKFGNLKKKTPEISPGEDHPDKVLDQNQSKKDIDSKPSKPSRKVPSKKKISSKSPKSSNKSPKKIPKSTNTESNPEIKSSICEIQIQEISIKLDDLTVKSLTHCFTKYQKMYVNKTSEGSPQEIFCNKIMEIFSKIIKIQEEVKKQNE